MVGVVIIVTVTFQQDFIQQIVLQGEAMTDEIELASCSRCEEKVDATTLAAYGNWELCEICQGDI